MCWMAANQIGAEKGQKVKLMFIDVKKAHLNRVVGDEWACIDLPDEDVEPGMCGRMRRWLYGMSPAASAWEKDYFRRLDLPEHGRGSLHERLSQLARRTAQSR